jgi:acyl-CoA reductase-like NAD-dependent aldehyde dehydrogenase
MEERMGDGETMVVARDGARGDRDASVEQVTAAVERARAAFATWSRLPFAARAAHLRRVRKHMLDNVDEIVDTIAASTHKLPTEAMVTEVLTTCELMEWYAKHGADALRPRRIPAGLLLAHKRAEKRYEPLGVIGVISPWNYPFTLTMSPVVTALYAGNTVVVKPSEITPDVGVLAARLFAEVGEHPDLVQAVVGGGEVGEALVRSGVEKVVFTGSVATGKRVMKAAADNLTPVLLELGGKDPFVVDADADVERAARAAVWGAFSNAGQTCMAVERTYVVDDVYDRFVDRVVELAGAVRPGRDIGTMTHEGQVAIVEEHVADAEQRGAKVVVGGKREPGSLAFPPTVLLDVDHSMKVMRDETFGPLLPIMRVRDRAEGVRLANDSPYGLNASVWAKDKASIEEMVSGIQSGNVCVNDCIVSFAIPGLPYGGVKDSGMGRTHGVEGLWEMSSIKAVAIDRLGLKREPQWFPLPRPLGRLARGLLRLRYGRGSR